MNTLDGPSLPMNNPNSKITLSLGVSKDLSLIVEKSSFVATKIPKSKRLASFSRVYRKLSLNLNISSVHK